MTSFKTAEKNVVVAMTILAIASLGAGPLHFLILSSSAGFDLQSLEIMDEAPHLGWAFLGKRTYLIMEHH